MKYFKVKLIFLVVIMMTVLAFSSSIDTVGLESAKSGINFSDSNIDSIIQKATTEQKMVYMSFYTTWCAPCQMMKLRTYRDREVGSYFNEHFLNVQINGDKGEGTEIASRFGVSSFPTLVFLEPDGTLFYKTSGFHNAEDLLKVAKEANLMYSSIKLGE